MTAGRKHDAGSAYEQRAPKIFAPEAYLDYGDVSSAEIAEWRARLDAERAGRKLRVVSDGRS